MALPNKVLPGFSATLYAQPGATPTPLTNAELATYADVSALAITANVLPVENIPAFGSDDAVASFGVAGSRQGDQIPVQNKPTSLSITAAWNPSSVALLQIRDDAYSGIIERTYVIAAVDGGDTVAYAFNARVGGLQWDMSPSAEGKFTFVIHPVGGNSYGWSND